MRSVWMVGLLLVVNAVLSHGRKRKPEPGLAAALEREFTKFCCAPTQFESFLSFMGATAQGATPVPVMVSRALQLQSVGRRALRVTRRH